MSCQNKPQELRSWSRAVLYFLGYVKKGRTFWDHIVTKKIVLFGDDIVTYRPFLTGQTQSGQSGWV